VIIHPWGPKNNESGHLKDSSPPGGRESTVGGKFYAKTGSRQVRSYWSAPLRAEMALNFSCCRQFFGVYIGTEMVAAKVAQDYEEATLDTTIRERRFGVWVGGLYECLPETVTIMSSLGQVKRKTPG